MPIVSFRSIKDSKKSAHSTVIINDVDTGEVWREKTPIKDLRGKSTIKFRWFAQSSSGNTLGRGTRVAMILGAGFPSRDKAVDALIESSMQQQTNDN